MFLITQVFCVTRGGKLRKIKDKQGGGEKLGDVVGTLIMCWGRIHRAGSRDVERFPWLANTSRLQMPRDELQLHFRFLHFSQGEAGNISHFGALSLNLCLLGKSKFRVVPSISTLHVILSVLTFICDAGV